MALVFPAEVKSETVVIKTCSNFMSRTYQPFLVPISSEIEFFSQRQNVMNYAQQRSTGT